MVNLSAEDKELMRALLQAWNPALLGSVEMPDLGLLPVEQREAISRAMGIERRINREKWFARSAEIERLVEYVWTSRPLAPDDAQLLRDAIEREAPSLLPLLNMIGTLELTQDESNALRLAIGHHLVSTGFGPRWVPNERGMPNARGIRLQALIDYLVHCVADWH